MSSARTLDIEKLRSRRVIATAAFTLVAVLFLLLEDTSARVSPAPPAADPSYQATDNVQPAATPRPVRAEEE